MMIIGSRSKLREQKSMSVCPTCGSAFDWNAVLISLKLNSLVVSNLQLEKVGCHRQVKIRQHSQYYIVWIHCSNEILFDVARNFYCIFNPLKPSVIIWLHFECSASWMPNLPLLISDIRALWAPECPNVGNYNSIIIIIPHFYSAYTVRGYRGAEMVGSTKCQIVLIWGVGL